MLVLPLADNVRDFGFRVLPYQFLDSRAIACWRMRDLDHILNNFQNGMSGAEAPGPDAVAQAEEAKAKANEFFKTEKYPLVSNQFWQFY